MAWQIKVLIALIEGTGSVSTVHRDQNPSLTPIPGDQTLSSGLQNECTRNTCDTQIHKTTTLLKLSANKKF